MHEAQAEEDLLGDWAVLLRPSRREEMQAKGKERNDRVSQVKSECALPIR